MKKHLSSQILLLGLFTVLFSCSSWKEAREKLKNPDYIVYGKGSTWEIKTSGNFLQFKDLVENDSKIIKSSLRGGYGSMVYESKKLTLSIFREKCQLTQTSKAYKYSAMLIKNQQTYKGCAEKNSK